MAHERAEAAVATVGRYEVHQELAAGGMATVHLGRMSGAAGFARTVAIKRLHRQYARDPGFVDMFLDEARLAARIVHPNVVATLDVVSESEELFLVMEYLAGESLARALAGARSRGERVPLSVVGAVMVSTLRGLHAAHEAVDTKGEALHVVHRDVSPQNVLVGVDGVVRLLDFGVAKAVGRLQETQDGQFKGKFSYMAPEQFRRGEITRAVDVYAAAVVMWEALTLRRLFEGEPANIIERTLYGSFRPPSELVSDLPGGVDELLCRGLSRAPEDRFATAEEMAAAVEKLLGVASPVEVAAWVRHVAGPALAARAELVAAVERQDAGPRRSSLLTSTRADAADTIPETIAVTGVPSSFSPARRPFLGRNGAVAGVALAVCAAVLVGVASRSPAAGSPERSVVQGAASTPAASTLAADPPAATVATVAVPSPEAPVGSVAPSSPVPPSSAASARKAVRPPRLRHAGKKSDGLPIGLPADPE